MPLSRNTWSLTHGQWGATEVFLAANNGLPSTLSTELSEGCGADTFEEDTAGNGETSQESGSLPIHSERIEGGYNSFEAAKWKPVRVASERLLRW